MELEKEEKNEGSRRKEITKIKAEIKQRKAMVFFEKTSKTGKLQQES